MKKLKIIFFQIAFLAILLNSTAQKKDFDMATRTTARFSHVTDQFGNEYPLESITLNSEDPFGKRSSEAQSSGKKSSNSTSAVPVNSCAAGYFDLYFAPGSLFDQNSSAAAVICEVFTNISGFISSPISPSLRINIYCDNNPSSVPSSVLGLGGLFYLYPYNPLNANGGVIYSQLQKALLTGQDPYANLPLSVFGGATNFYHSYMYVNPNAAWNLNMATTSIGSSYDLYSVVLHEAMHILGFASLIKGNGTSVLGAANNYFGAYDKFLTNAAGTPLLAGITGCPTSGLTFQGPATAINPGNCLGGGADITNCATAARYIDGTINVAVYTPNCFENGSSLSHFEDMCDYGAFTTGCTPVPSSPGYNNLCYAMSNATNFGNCFVKRKITPEERYVLCDLGYAVGLNYTSNAAGATTTYTGSACSSPNVWGMHDGLSAGSYIYTSTGGSYLLSFASILGNDASIATQISCIDVVYNTTASWSFSGVNLLVTATPGSGLTILKYLPTTSGGLKGGPTYIYIYFLESGCSSDPCNLVQNGDLETLGPGSLAPCGILSAAYVAKLSCWLDSGGSPDLYTRGCQWSTPQCNLGTNTWGSWPPVDSHNGSPNNRVIGQGGGESIKNSLGAPLIPGQAYQLSIWLHAPSDPIYNPYTTPIVVAVAADLNITTAVVTPYLYPLGSASLGEFTITPGNPWAQFTNTFVFTPTTGLTSYNSIVMQMDIVQTTFLAAGTYTRGYYFFDDVSIVPIPNTPVFSIPQAANCGNTTITNLEQYTTLPGTFSGPGLTPGSGGTTDFNNPATLPSGSYNIGFTFVMGGCTTTVYQNILIETPNFALSTGFNPVYCLNLSPPPPVTLTVNSVPPSGVTYLWQPGNIAGQSPTITPFSNQVYTVFAMGNCMLTATLAVTISNSCCPQTPTLGAITSTLIGGATINGPTTILENITIGPGLSYFTNGEFLMAPGVKITIQGGGQLHLHGVHLYACSTTMWQGIDVLNNGRLLAGESYTTGNTTLIEDAITAVNINNVNAVPTMSLTEIWKTIFNKNYVSISVNNAVTNATPLWVVGSVFTSRNLPFTSTSWPNASTTGTGLRAPANPLTGLITPFDFNGAAPSNLKSPYNSQPGHIGVRLTDVGNTTGFPAFGVVVGNTLGTNDNYNLFDGLGYGIYAVNSNVLSVANIFQNTRRYTVGMNTVGGAGIYHKCNTLMNTSLSLNENPPNPTMGSGNMFWDCHKAIEGYDLYELEAEYSIFRSNQSTSSTSGLQPGNTGIYLNTSRFKYNISNNLFNNVNTGVNIEVNNGTFNVGSGIVAGVYANGMSINGNVFAPQISSAITPVNEYLNQAIVIDGNNASNLLQANGSTLDVLSNNVKLAYRGISAMGMNNYPININGNWVNLTDDNTFFTPQTGINLQNTRRNVEIKDNFLTATGILNPLITLVYCDNNPGSGFVSPIVTCNVLNNSYNAFVFNRDNSGSSWMGNTMENHQNGLSLTTNGIIGNQGSPSTPSENKWLGPWTTELSTFVDGSSNATLSKLYLSNFGYPFFPTNNGASASDYNLAGTLFVVGGGPYNCPPTLPAPPSYRSGSFSSLLDPEINNVTINFPQPWKLNLFPNPTDGKINIVTEKENDNLHVKVTDLSGKLLFDNTLTTNNFKATFDLWAEQGMYLVEIKNDRYTVVKKITLLK
jgi:hypothetical protein